LGLVELFGMTYEEKEAEDDEEEENPEYDSDMGYWRY
jgi:hypothetical protein